MKKKSRQLKHMILNELIWGTKCALQNGNVYASDSDLLIVAILIVELQVRGFKIQQTFD